MINIQQIEANGYVFDVRTAGQIGQETLFFLHGFPETSHLWVELMKDLSHLGYFCIAPNLRGYSLGAQPKGKKHYAIQHLLADIHALADHFGLKRFHLVGHDWGAIIGWAFAAQFPQCLLSWTALSVPHPQAFGEALANDPAQAKMSAYMKRFQIPWLPERKIRKNDFKLFRRLWSSSNEEQLADYLSVFRQANTVSASINYYRANYKMLKAASHKRVLGNIQVPTLFIWGANDFAVGAYGVNQCKKYVTADYNFQSVEGGHWLMQGNYGEVKDLLVKHIQKYKLG